MNARKLLILPILLLSLPALANPGPKPWIWSWADSHWDNQDFIPYLEDGTHPHNSQWDAIRWKPDDWIAQRKDALTLVKGFYDANIIKRQYIRDKTPVLVVGPSFYLLGGEDKRRVMATVDSVWKITSSHPNGMFMLYDWDSDEPIGAYTKDGLQIQ